MHAQSHYEQIETACKPTFLLHMQGKKVTLTEVLPLVYSYPMMFTVYVGKVKRSQAVGSEKNTVDFLYLDMQTGHKICYVYTLVNSTGRLF